MAEALRLAAKGRGRTSPNPMVGAVVVARGRVVGRGYHRRAGGPHAEVFALRQAGVRARGATLYVTLEPCCHRKKRTPPCVPAVVTSGIRRVVVGMPDPNPSVSGRGIAALRRAGLAVTVGCRREEAERLNDSYAYRMQKGFPLVILKAATTLDGKITTASGASRWITGKPARLDAHRLRSEVDAILVGIGTVLKDDPRLTVRLPGVKSRQPLRVILDSRLRLPLSARILSAERGRGVVVMTTAEAPRARIARLQRRGVSVLVLPAAAGRVPMRRALQALARVGVNSLLIEGGADVNASALCSGLVNRLVWYVAPHVLGGRNALSVIGGSALNRLAEKIVLTDMQVRRVGRDLRFDVRIQP